MIIKKVQNKAEGSELAAEIFIELSNKKPTKPVGLATGETMAGVYQQLATKGFKPSFENAFALDEYARMDKTHPNSYYSELNENFSKLLGFDGRLHVPGQDEYSAQDLQSFEDAIEEHGPLSVQLLGLGTNGHIAFNEPGSSFDSTTREVELHEETRVANSRFFESVDQVPTHALTQGLATIAKADALLLLVFGEGKKAALKKSLENPDESTPLAALSNHQNLILITDIDL